jgi:methionine sulfoxide reductase heme-binding subunit
MNERYSGRYFNGWAITGWAALGIGLMSAILLAMYGAGERGLHLIIRSTAQTSFALFVSAFIASPLLKLWPARATAWLRANRRYLGVSFAVSHVCHALAIITLGVITSGASLGESETSSIVGGLIAYGLILAMAATSFDRTARWLGQRAWRRLHTTGMYVLWTVFALAYLPRAFNSMLYLPPALVIIAAMMLRIAARTVRLQRKAASAG